MAQCARRIVSERSGGVGEDREIGGRMAPLHPQAEAFLKEMEILGAPAMETVPIEQVRADMEASIEGLGTPEPVPSVNDFEAKGPAGAIPLRVYGPEPGSTPTSTLVFFHGGGWVAGSIATHDAYCRSLRNATEGAVVSVEYRLAPEHPYPAAADDGYAATRWVADHAEELGVAGELVVIGDSAGGNLAAAVALMARDRGGPRLAAQVLIYPVIEADFETASYREHATGKRLTRAAMMHFWNLYAGPAEHRGAAYAAPSKATELEGTPPALVLVAGHDPLCDEGVAYAERLEASDVPTVLVRYDGMIHGFAHRTNLFDDARDAVRRIAEFLELAVAAAKP